MKILILLLILAVIGFILWWFFAPHEKSAEAELTADGRQIGHITVDGGYVPETLLLKAGVPTTLVIHRKDPSTCLERVVFPDFAINEFLPQNEDVEIPLDASRSGEYNYACGMNMFHGKVIIK